MLPPHILEYFTCEHLVGMLIPEIITWYHEYLQKGSRKYVCFICCLCLTFHSDYLVRLKSRTSMKVFSDMSP